MSDYLDNLVTRVLGTALVVQPRPVARFEPAAAIGAPLATADSAMEQISPEPPPHQELGRPAPSQPPVLSARPLQPAPPWLAVAPRHPLEPPWHDPRGQHAARPAPPAERAAQPEADTLARRESRPGGPPLAPPPTVQPPIIRVERAPDQSTPPTADSIMPAIVQSPAPPIGPLHTRERIIERMASREPSAQAAAPTPLLPTQTILEHMTERIVVEERLAPPAAHIEKAMPPTTPAPQRQAPAPLVERVVERVAPPAPFIERVVERQTPPAPLIERVVERQTPPAPLIERVIERQTPPAPLIERVIERQTPPAPLIERVIERLAPRETGESPGRAPRIVAGEAQGPRAEPALNQMAQPPRREPNIVQPRMRLAAPAASAAPAPAPTIQVTIGRVEVRATPAQPAPSRQPQTPAVAMSLDEYLRQRKGGGAR